LGLADRRWRTSGRKLLGVLLLGMLCGSLGCWEQVSSEWFPQMKRQLAVQAFENNPFTADGQALTPPDGTVPVGDPVLDLKRMQPSEQEMLRNPVPARLASLKEGEVLFRRYCVACHGPEGHGDGPVAGAPFGKGPFGMVLPIGGPSSIARGLSDGHIFTTITWGRIRMPSYRRISPHGRWSIVNYIRDLNVQGDRQ